MVGIIKRLMPDESRELFQRAVPEAPSRPQGGGRRRHGDREVLTAIVFVATSGRTWQQLPSASFGPSRATAHRRFSGWSKARVWAKLHHLVLDGLGARGELDRSRCTIDSVNTQALKRGDLTGPNPVDRGKYSSKTHLIMERSGLPTPVGIPGTNLHYSQALIPFVGGASRRSVRAEAGDGASPANSTPTRATTTATCGVG
jgi:transposase